MKKRRKEGGVEPDEAVASDERQRDEDADGIVGSLNSDLSEILADPAVWRIHLSQRDACDSGG